MDRRKRKTREAIFRAFTDLLSTKSFEQITGYDISALAYMEEQAVYANTSLNDTDRTKATEIYHGAMGAVKEKKKNSGKVVWEDMM